MYASYTRKDIEKAGKKALVVIYGCTTSESLNAARVAKFQQKVATAAGYVPPEKLTPTKDAAAFHSERTYHQVQAWCGNDMSPEIWGWRAYSAGLVPVKMIQSAAPDELLKIVLCNCGGNCTNTTCSCRKNGLQCTSACGQCRGITCMNGPQVEIEEDENDQDN